MKGLYNKFAMFAAMAALMQQSPTDNKYKSMRPIKEKHKILPLTLEAHPRHCIKPLRPIQPTRFFYSTSDIK